MKLYWCPRTRAARVVWMLEEAGVDYQRVLVDIHDTDAPRDPDFLAASPMGKVPALEDGEVRMADSAAICLYLAEQYPGAGLAPPVGDPRRGKYLYWMLYTPGAIEPAVMEKIAGIEPNRVSAGWGDFPTMIETLARAIGGGPWILGSSFSAADVLLGTSVHYLRAFDMLPDSPPLASYLERCLARPALLRALALDEPAGG